MGASHSTPTSSSSRSEVVRPVHTRRLSSFGRPSIRSKRHSSHGDRVLRSGVHTAESGAGAMTPIATRTPDSEVTAVTTRDVLVKGKGKVVEDGGEQDGGAEAEDLTKPVHEEIAEKGSPPWITPSLPTSPGPPVLPTAEHSNAGPSSYFPPLHEVIPAGDCPSGQVPAIRVDPSPSSCGAVGVSSPATALSSTVPPDTNSTTDAGGSLNPGEGVSASSPGITLPRSTDNGIPPHASSRPLSSRRLSMPNPHIPSPLDRSMTGRLTALLGFSAPSDPSASTSSSTGPSSSSSPTSPSGDLPDLATSPLSSPLLPHGEPSTSAEAEVRARLARARQHLEELRAELSHMQENGASRPAEASRPAPAPRIPIGAMLVIQGLAQTHITSDDDEGSGNASASSSASTTSQSTPAVPLDGDGEPSSSRPRRPSHLRRLSDGSFLRRRRDQERDRDRGASLDQQARMIGGLLTVAAAATANTLLTPPEPPQSTPAPRSGVAGAIDTLLNRIRPSRSPRQGIEAALGQYLRNVVRDNRRSTGDAGFTLPVIEPTGGREVGPGFETFLHSLQGDLVEAVRTYANSTRSADEESLYTPTDTASTAVSSQVGETQEDSIAAEDTQSTPAAADSATTAPEDGPRPIPTFHHQLGQTTQQARPNRYGVTGGTDGVPRRLNFFRAHLFPPIVMPNGPPSAADTSASTGVNESTSASASSSAAQPVSSASPVEDPNAIIPCIFIGVRSIRHDPGTTPEELFNQPGLFNGDNAAAPSTPSATTSPASPANATASTAATPGPSENPASRPSLSRVSSSTGPRTLRDRFLARVARRQPTAQSSSTYLVYVIGGNYPRNHPVLRIPNLITGEPLTDEDMQLIGELMGPAKPPTASKDEIDKAGLRLVDGSTMKELGEKGEVMDNCVERCLICLADFEAGEACRVLACKHGFHKECVDHWLSEGSNSCPACRSEAVDKSKVSEAAGRAESSDSVSPTAISPESDSGIRSTLDEID